MSVYGQIFSTSGETAQIERTERRYAWLRRRLRSREDIMGIFPEPWRLALHICLAFAQQTRVQLSDILASKVCWQDIWVRPLFNTYKRHVIH